MNTGVRFETLSSDARCLLGCLLNMRHIEATNQRNDSTSNASGWCPKESYEDSEGWARFYAARIIEKSTKGKP